MFATDPRAAQTISWMNGPENTIVTQATGPCHHVRDGECQVFNTPARPPACDSFEFGGDRCTQRRTQNGLPPVKK